MGKIIRNGVEFSGTLDNAANVNYNNELSGMEATTVQEAIDELDNSTVKSINANVTAIYNPSVGSYCYQKWNVSDNLIYQLQMNDSNLEFTKFADGNLSSLFSLNKIRTYVGSDGKLHFTDASGADTVLPFSKSTIDLLYQNNNTTLAPGTIITTDMTKYDFALMQINTWYTGKPAEFTGRFFCCPVGQSGTCVMDEQTRTFTVTNTGISSSSPTQNGSNVPYRIYGVKL